MVHKAERWKVGGTMSLISNRSVLLFASILLLGMLTFPSPAQADDEEPLAARIFDANWNHVEMMTVTVNQTFDLYGHATGGFIPYRYVWRDGVLILATTSVLSHSLSEPGDYVIVLIVRDMLDQESTDSVSVTVLPATVPVSRNTWGAVKSLYRA